MLIVKPYGRSVTERRNNRITRQMIVRNSDKDGNENESSEISTLKDNPEFIIAQWISIIDRIIRKPAEKNKSKERVRSSENSNPTGSNKPTELQANLRKKLGCMAWNHIKTKKLLGEKADYEKQEKIWRWKLHPYWPEKNDPKGKVNKTNAKIDIRGRFYRAFIGNDEPKVSDITDQVIEKIYGHLYANTLKITGKQRANGKIDCVLDSVHKSVPPLPALDSVHKSVPPRHANAVEITDNDFNKNYNKYCEDIDIAKEIFDKCQSLKKRSLKNYRETIFSSLYEQYKNVFGENCSIHDAKTKKPELLRVHETVKDTYKHLLKRKRYDFKTLSNNKEALFALISKHQNNISLSSLVRLGKIIHYQSNSRCTLPDLATIKNSKYWLSEGQTEIKRNEALVRVWKLAVCQAQHSLSYWAGANAGNDIFTGTMENHIKANPDEKDEIKERFEKLFGDSISSQRHINIREILICAGERWKNLRNSCFHFKNRNDFIQSLQNNNNTDFICQLWKNDCKRFDERLRETLKGLQTHQFLDANQYKKIYNAIKKMHVSEIPLPRFNKLLEAHTNHKWGLNLPEKATSRQLESDEWLRCRYQMLKMLYERDFPHWLSGCSLKNYIKKAIDKADEKAREINKNDLIASKMNTLVDWKNISELTQFLRKLTAASAIEFRVQRGYGHDAENARKQSSFIEKLKQNVILQAFADYLNENRWCFLLCRKKNKVDGSSNYIDDSEVNDSAEEWQKNLYFMLFMVPVGTASALMHQLRKWEILTEKAQNDNQGEKEVVRKVSSVLTLYLNMHDARFDGRKTLSVPEEMKSLFEDENQFTSRYSQTLGQPSDESQANTLPIRGLRELLRFGLDKKLLEIYQKQKISTKKIKELEDLEEGQSCIQIAQEKKQELHNKYVNKQKFNDKDYKDYNANVRTIIQYRELSSQIRFTNHFRLYRLTMTVLARLVDYAGLWERDMYFITLALMHQQSDDRNINTYFNNNGYQYFINGQIVEALKNLNCDMIKDEVNRYMNMDNTKVIRNALSHMNMLRDNCPLDMTRWVNETRNLMSYDRKMKNAVSKSIIELFKREGLLLKWRMCNHELTKATISPKTITHLGGKGEKEALHGEDYCQMVAELMGGCYNPPNFSKRGNDRNKANNRSKEIK